MAEKIEKSIPWLTILVICTLAVFGVVIVLEEVTADVITPSVQVGNVGPTVGTVILNGGSDITITENTTVTVAGTTTVTDTNGYQDITSVTSTLFLNNTTSCGTLNANWCYNVDWVSCVTSSCSGNSCDVSCSASVWFIAEPSDASGSYAAKVWQIDITALDTGASTDTGSSSEELITAYYLDVDSDISYGSVNPGATSSPNQTTNATNTGNYHIDVELYGDNMATGSYSIAVGQQKYSSSSINDWDTMGTALTGSPVGYNLLLDKPTATTSNSTDDIYWVIKIPDGQEPDTYTGTNTALAVTAI